MIKYRNTDGRTKPFVTCDYCGNSIKNSSGAGVVYKTATPGAAESDGVAFFAHKGDCMDALENKFGEDYDGWEELSRFLSFVTNNVKLSPDDIRQTLQMNRETGF